MRYLENIDTFVEALVLDSCHIVRNARLNGNRVKIPNSTRCCKFPPTVEVGVVVRHSLPLTRLGLGRRRNRNKSEDLPV